MFNFENPDPLMLNFPSFFSLIIGRISTVPLPSLYPLQTRCRVQLFPFSLRLCPSCGPAGGSCVKVRLVPLVQVGSDHPRQPGQSTEQHVCLVVAARRHALFSLSFPFPGSDRSSALTQHRLRDMRTGESGSRVIAEPTSPSPLCQNCEDALA